MDSTVERHLARLSIEGALRVLRALELSKGANDLINVYEEDRRGLVEKGERPLRRFDNVTLLEALEFADDVAVFADYLPGLRSDGSDLH